MDNDKRVNTVGKWNSYKHMCLIIEHQNMTQKLTEMKGEIKIIVGGFNTLFAILGRKTKCKIKRESKIWITL